MKQSLFFVYSGGFLTVFVVYSGLNCLYFCAQPTVALRTDPGEEFVYVKTPIFGVFRPDFHDSVDLCEFCLISWNSLVFIIIKITKNYL